MALLRDLITHSLILGFSPDRLKDLLAHPFGREFGPSHSPFFVESDPFSPLLSTLPLFLSRRSDPASLLRLTDGSFFSSNPRNGFPDLSSISKISGSHHRIFPDSYSCPPPLYPSFFFNPVSF